MERDTITGKTHFKRPLGPRAMRDLGRTRTSSTSASPGRVLIYDVRNSQEQRNSENQPAVNSPVRHPYTTSLWNAGDQQEVAPQAAPHEFFIGTDSLEFEPLDTPPEHSAAEDSDQSSADTETPPPFLRLQSPPVSVVVPELLQNTPSSVPTLRAPPSPQQVGQEPS